MVEPEPKSEPPRAAERGKRRGSVPLGIVCTGALALPLLVVCGNRMANRNSPPVAPAPSASITASAVSSADLATGTDGWCAASPRCQKYGLCSLRDGRCVPTRPEHCQATEQCKKTGACGVGKDGCFPTEAAHCEKSEHCRTEGACGLAGDHCVPTAPEHCQRSEVCRKDGMCRIVGGDPEFRQCGMDAHADCAKTAFCRDEGRCRLAPLDFGGGGRCIKAELVPRRRFRLTEARHGVRGELVVSTDKRLPPARYTRDYGGYFVDEDDPRAGSAVELRNPAGEVVEELTLYPAVSVEVKDLGHGTDTWFATEEILCAAGHWCGWGTHVIEVRDGHLAQVRARGQNGELREVDLAASMGSRWKVARGANPGKQEIVYQVEQAEIGDDQVLTTTRFFFADGVWQFADEYAKTYDPRVVKQPGQWRGSLEFHASERPNQPPRTKP
jgi:hypothetical protein